MKRPGEFTKETKDLLAKRVGYLCSRASCRRRTVGPHSSVEKTTSVGEASHICAASPNGPRYDASMTDEERKSPENGIWLCAICATEIDKDYERFSVSRLRNWKEDSEKEAQKSLGKTCWRLGISRSAFSPPLNYQRQALEQVIAHLKNSGIKAFGLLQLRQSLSSPIRDGINPIFEPLSVETVTDAIDEFISSGKLGVKGELFVIN